MSLIQVKNLTFSYPGALTPVFNHVNLGLDTNWRLGLVGRNGRGKTTFLNLLQNRLQGTGSIYTPEKFEYFPLVVQDTQQTALQVARELIAPFDAWERKMQQCTQQATQAGILEYGEVEHAYSTADGYIINESIAAETGRLGIHASVLQHPYASLSSGERVKLQLAALFLKKHRFLLIDEPTDHLDAEGRQRVARWLAGKQGFILVSHDRAFLDEAVDHILSINRADIELQKGNYSSWRHNRDLKDGYEIAENSRLEASIGRLKTAAERTEKWSDKIEKSKSGNTRSSIAKGAGKLDRGYIGHQSAKMMQRSKSIEHRRAHEIEEKQGLLKNIETTDPLVFHTLAADKNTLATCEGCSVQFGKRVLFENVSFTIEKGERIAVTGVNGCGKSSLLRLLLGTLAPTAGRIRRMGGLVISTLPQETNFLNGSLQEYAKEQGLEPSLFLALLRKLDFERTAFTQDMGSYSSGQKKKACLAASLAKPAHLFIWDEPLNYIDVLSREQIESAVCLCRPTMLFVEHDAAFLSAVATRYLPIGK